MKQLLVLVLLAVPLPALAQEPVRLVGPSNFLEPEPVPPLANIDGDIGRQMRNYPEQPPVIPHEIDGYQMTISTNACLSCHRRQYTEASGAPMISITHYMDREGQMLADVSMRRYFCTQCHVVQSEARLLVGNTFVDMLDLKAQED